MVLEDDFPVVTARVQLWHFHCRPRTVFACCGWEMNSLWISCPGAQWVLFKAELCWARKSGAHRGRSVCASNLLEASPHFVDF